jgi:Rrf2 family protein
MSLISRKVDYAILTLAELVRSGDGCGASARELAERHGLSKAFVANILKELCQAGIVESQRGVHGGYRLAKPAACIAVSDLIAALDGAFQFMACAGDRAAGEHDCGLAASCPVRGPLRRVHERLLAVLADVTLADLSAPAGGTSQLVALAAALPTPGPLAPAPAACPPSESVPMPPREPAELLENVRG